MANSRTKHPEAMQISQIKTRALVAGKWALAGEFVARLAQPAVLVILARLLAPADFGIVTAATIVVSFAQTFWESGLARALVQRQAEPSEIRSIANAVHWINVALALVFYAAVYAGADWIARVFGDPRIAPLMQVQGLAIPLAAFNSVPLALLQRDMCYRPVFASRLAAAVMPGLIGVPFALAGFGYWALVAGSLAGTLVQTVVLSVLSDWRPNRPGSWRPAGKLLNFGAWSAGETTLSWSMLWLDALVVGLYFTSHELGLFRTGSMMVAMAFGLPLGPLMPILFAMMARMQLDQAALRSSFMTAVKGVTLTASLLMALAASAPTEWSMLLFGERWRDMGEIVQILSVTYAISWMVAPNAELYRAMGRPDLNLKMIAGCLLVYVPVLAWGARNGMTTFLWARMLTACFGFTVHLIVAWRMAKISPLEFFRAVGLFFAGGLAAGLAGHVVGGLCPPGNLMRIAGSTFASFAVFAVVGTVERRFIANLVTTIWHRRRHASPSDEAAPGHPESSLPVP